MKKYAYALITALLVITMMVMLSVTCFGIYDNTGNDQALNDLRAVAESYYQKVPDAHTAAEGSTYSAVKVYVDKIDALRQETDRNTEAEMQLEYHKGVAAGILSWIYYSNGEVSVESTYSAHLNKIDRADITFFDGTGEETVEDSYVKMFYDVYYKKINDIRDNDESDGEKDSDTVTTIIDNALIELGRAPYNEYDGDEDGAKYKLHYNETLTLVNEQRNRDRTKYQLLSVYDKLYPKSSIPEDELREFLRLLGGKNTTSDMNALLKSTINTFINELRTGAADYKYQYLSSKIIEIDDAVDYGNSVFQIADIKSIFLNYTEKFAIADAKDALAAYADGIKNNYVPDDVTALNAVVAEFNGENGLLDGATTVERVDELLFIAKTRCEWFDMYRDARDRINGYLDGGDGREEITDSELPSKADKLYADTVTAINGGERSGGDDIAANLLGDNAALQGLVTEAEAERFKTDHKTVIGKTEVTPADKTALVSAIADAEGLTDGAEELLSDILTDIGEKYKAVVSAQIDAHVTDDLAKAERTATAEQLKALVEALSAKNGDGNFDLSGLKESADEYLAKSEAVKALYDAYGEYLSGGSEYYGDTAKQTATDGAGAVISTADGNEAAIVARTVTSLGQLAALEDINEAAKGYETVGDIPAILDEAEDGIKSCDTDTEISDYRNSAIAEISEIARLYEIELAKNGDGALADTVDNIKALIEGCKYISGEQKNAFLSELNAKNNEAVAAIEGAADASAVKSALASAKEGLSKLSDRVNAAELAACLADAKATLNICYGKREDYSADNYIAIIDLIDTYEGRLDGVGSVAEYETIREEGKAALLAVEDLLEEALRIGAERLTAAYEELMSEKHCYSAKNFSELSEIYEHSLAELASKYTKVSDYTGTIAFVDERIAVMRGIKRDMLYTSDGLLATDGNKVYPDGYDSAASGFIGAVWAENGIPYDATLKIDRVDIDGIADAIKRASKDKLVLVGGSSAERGVIKALKNCQVLLGIDIGLGDILPSGGGYRVSVLLPEGIDGSDILGVVFVRDDGSIEFFETTPDASLLEFTTSHFSKFYVVGRGAVDLVPLIVCLSIIVLCELCVIALLLFRRIKRQREFLLSALAPTALAVRYRPAGGNVVAILLGGAAVALGALIAYLVACEVKDAKSKKTEMLPVPAELPVPEPVAVVVEPVPVEHAEEPTPTEEQEPMEQVSVEEAEALMTDTEAHRLQSESLGYEDIEIYRGTKKAEVNIDVISETFEDGDTVTLNSLKEKKLVPQSAGYVKILARGVLRHRLRIVAQDFSDAAVKMILLTGGEAIKTYPSRERGGRG